ncbi:MAG: nitroreductase family protein [Candidatus Latescibacterota bacterium]
MDALDAILSRRSIRQYTPQAVSDETVTELMAAAMAAPSAGNEQPWHFIVMDDRELLDAVPKFHPHSWMLEEAPIAILVCGDTTLQKYEGYWVQDCAAATENLLIAAQANGLGTVWLGVYPVDERVVGFQKLLGLPDHVIPFALISLGYPAEDKPRADRYDASRVRRNRW